MVIPCEGTVNDAVTMTVTVTLRLFHLFVLAGKDVCRLAGTSDLAKFHKFDVCGIKL